MQQSKLRKFPEQQQQLKELLGTSAVGRRQNQRDGIYRERIGNIFLLKPSQNTKNAFYSLHHFGDKLNIFFTVNRQYYYI